LEKSGEEEEVEGHHPREKSHLTGSPRKKLEKKKGWGKEKKETGKRTTKGTPSEKIFGVIIIETNWGNQLQTKPLL